LQGPYFWQRYQSWGKVVKLFYECFCGTLDILSCAPDTLRCIGGRMSDHTLWFCIQLSVPCRLGKSGPQPSWMITMQSISI
jgi:hypothetical protein